MSMRSLWFAVMLALCAGCQQHNPMQTVFSISDDASLNQALLEFKQTAPEHDYQLLVEAIAEIRTFDTSLITQEDYWSALNGKTPAQLIDYAQSLSKP